MIVLTASIFACGGGETAEADLAVAEKENLIKDYEPLDLTTWGFNMTMLVPNAKDYGDVEVTLTERGSLEIKVGRSFGLEIAYGEGDIALLKSDLKDNLVYVSEIILEEPDALIYKQEIPDSGIKTKNHFFYKAVVGSDVYEVRDLIDGKYGKKFIEKMLAAAKTLQPVDADAKVTNDKESV